MTNFPHTNNPKGPHVNREQKANRKSTPNTGLAATLSKLSRSEGTGAPSSRQAQSLRLPLAILTALALFTSLAFTAVPVTTA